MDTQATAPGNPSAGAGHPIHHETEMVERLTQIVRDTPDNDPHEGTDLELPKKPEAEEPEKQEAQQPETQEETFEIPEDEPLFDVPDLEDPKKTVKASLKELREQRMMKGDYHRNIQKVKQQEAQLQSQMQQAELKAQQDYAQRLETHKQAISRLAGVKSMQEIEALSRQDPAAAQQEFLRLVNVNQTLQAIEAEQRQVVQKIQTDQQTAMQAAIQSARSTLESDIPGWGQEKYQQVLEGVAKDYGFEPKDVATVYDARLIKVFHDAFQYRQLQKAKPGVEKRVVAVPKVLKPGSADKVSPAKEASDVSREKLKKSGRGEHFVQWYLNKNKKGK